MGVCFNVNRTARQKISQMVSQSCWISRDFPDFPKFVQVWDTVSPSSRGVRSSDCMRWKTLDVIFTQNKIVWVNIFQKKSYSSISTTAKPKISFHTPLSVQFGVLIAAPLHEYEQELREVPISFWCCCSSCCHFTVVARLTSFPCERSQHQFTPKLWLRNVRSRRPSAVST